MIRRIIVFMIVFTISTLTPKIHAVWTIDYAPYVKVENEYSTNVSCGTIRYVSQISSSSYFYSAYWPNSSFGGYGSPKSECGTASISMALSYVGINKTPKAILGANNGYTYFSGWGAATSSPTVAVGMNNYISGNGQYSPVIIHLPKYSVSGHWVVLISKVSSNVYQVLDPAKSDLWNITISGNSATYSKDGYTVNDTIDRTYQYYNPEAYIDASVERYRPGKPSLIEMKSTYAVNSAIIFKWKGTSNTTHYNLYIQKKNSVGNYDMLEDIYYATSGISRLLSMGEYRVRVQSINSNYKEADGSSWLFRNGDWHYFSVEHLHNYSSFLTEATCTEQGYTLYICTECNDRYTSNQTAALGHAWNSGVVTLQPTATQDGLKTYTCTRCWETKTEEIPATGAGASCNGGSSCPSGKFKDIKASDWFHESVDFAVSQGLFGGMSDTTFAPNTAMTRAMLVTVLWRYAGQPMESVNNFTDVAKNQWYTNAVAWAANNGVVTGVGNNKFNPNGNITREQMAAILYRYANGRGIDTSASADLSAFPDGNKVSSYAKDAIQWAVAEGLINGSDGKLMPQGNATRAQVAAILMRFIKN